MRENSQIGTITHDIHGKPKMGKNMLRNASRIYCPNLSSQCKNHLQCLRTLALRNHQIPDLSEPTLRENQAPNLSTDSVSYKHQL